MNTIINNYNEEDNLDYVSEINEESAAKEDKNKDSVMKDINSELKTLKAIKFKDFRDIMATYNSGNAIIESASAQALNVLKSVLVQEMFSEKYADKDIISLSDKIFEEFVQILAVQLRQYIQAPSDPVKYFRPYANTAIQNAIKKDMQNKQKKKAAVSEDEIVVDTKYNYICAIETPTVADLQAAMDEYKKGDVIRKSATDDACVNLKGFIIYTIMHSFWTYCKSHFFDMLQCGYVGVLKGMDAYNPDKALPTTFFKTYIKCEITRYITEFLNGSTVHYATTLAKVNRAKRYFEEIGVESKDSAIAEYLGISPTSVREALASQEACISVNYQDEFENATDEDVPSMNNTFMNPEKSLEQKILNEAIAEAISDLTENEQTIISLYYGFDGERLSPNKIAAKTGLSTDTVKQLHQSALNQLYSSKLRDLYDDSYREGPGIETIEFLPETEEEADIVDFSFEDFINANASTVNEIFKEEGDANGKVLSGNTTSSGVSFMFRV